MEPKKRLLVTLAVVALIAGAMLVSFGRNLVALNTPRVVLADTSGSGSDTSDGSLSPSNVYQRVEVTPRTVQSVIATLDRSDSYYRELTVESFWTGGSSSTAVQVWCDGDWCHVRQALPSGAVRHDLTGGGKLYYWYDGSQQYQAAPADGLSADLAQHITTYETVLQLRQSAIVAADYRQLEGLSCIYVEVRLDDPQRTERYWIGLDSGLLVQAEAEETGTLTYRLSALSPITTAYNAAAAFSLPDGTSLHNVT